MLRAVIEFGMCFIVSLFVESVVSWFAKAIDMPKKVADGFSITMFCLFFVAIFLFTTTNPSSAFYPAYQFIFGW